jgi:hypothetical protein
MTRIAAALNGHRPGTAPAAILSRAVVLLRRVGPYAAIELLLPGGSLLALFLWLYRRQRGPSGRLRHGPIARGGSQRERGEQLTQSVEIERLDQVRIEPGLA